MYLCSNNVSTQLLDFSRKTEELQVVTHYHPHQWQKKYLTGVNAAICHSYNTFRSLQLNRKVTTQHNTLRLCCREGHYHCEHLYGENFRKVTGRMISHICISNNNKNALIILWNPFQIANNRSHRALKVSTCLCTNIFNSCRMSTSAGKYVLWPRKKTLE